jgi:exopolyphosphatase/guanosine-5'-triphosphate,3'-diphosphate pyrophosphatase
MLTSNRFAAIDIGSNAVRLLLSEVFETQNGPYFRKISLIRMPIRMGRDAFIHGKISKPKAAQLLNTIKGFQSLVSAYRPVDFRACATSAMRESGNGAKIKNRIKDQTGVDIKIISGKEEARIIFANNPWSHLAEGSAWLFIDVGGGSTEITIYSNGKIVSRSFGIGTIRLLEELVSRSQWKEMKAWIVDHTRSFASIDAIGSGGNINKIIKLAKCSDGKAITRAKMKKVRNNLKFFTYDDRITKLGLKPDRADVIMPALKIYMSVMKWGGIKTISVPQIGLADGLVRIMHRKHVLKRSRRMNQPLKKRTKPASKILQTRSPGKPHPSVACRM